MRTLCLLSALIATLLATPVFAQQKPAQTLIGACARCHGEDGNSSGHYPSLARQQAEYTLKQLMDFKSGARKNGEMSPMVGVLTESNMQVLAEYYADENLNRQRGLDEELAAEGKKVAAEFNCASCHQKNYRGVSTIPRIARQKRVYLVQQMENFRDGTRTNDGGLKIEMFKNVTDEQIKAMSHYFAGM